MKLHSIPTRNRREFLTDAFCGFGSLAFGAMLQSEARGAVINPLAPKQPNSPEDAKAKSVIFLFMAGGPSQMETFDPKPLLNKLDGQPVPPSFQAAKRQFIKGPPKLLGTKRSFQQYGKSGLRFPIFCRIWPIARTTWRSFVLARPTHSYTPRRSISFSPAVSCRVFRAWGHGRYMGWAARALRFRVM